jgi:iron complex outermembrane receptor protein
MRSRRLPLATVCGLLATVTHGQEPIVLDPVVSTATRVEQSSFDAPAAIDSVPGRVVREQQIGVNLSESVGRVPGLVVQNRQNYAQDLQVSSRGFGARASFGVRGVRLMQDGIPLTMPDGQGQTGLFDLDSARRIEVLRGPFSALYGNSSGGVVQLFTDPGPAAPTLRAAGYAGSFGTWKLGAGFGGRFGALQANGDLSRFETDGYRDHSWARRDIANARLGYAIDDASTLTFIANALDQPDTLDPLGLTRAQVEADPRQAGTGAIAFDTRKSIRHMQGGLAYERQLSAADTIRASGYLGDRQITQYLAFTGAAPTSSGGVVDLDRGFGGASLQWTRATALAGTPFKFTLGVDYDRMSENRRGYVNDFGTAGALRRNEDDVVYDFDQYAIFEWSFAERWKLSGGLRHSSVRFSSTDLYITPVNPDDSGSVDYSRTSPVAGILYELTDAVNVYAAAGGGFETPTFAELAYRPDGQPGLNFGLQAATSVNYEVGVKALVGERSRVSVAVFLSETKNDIVNGPQIAPGRNTFVNAGETRRYGVELGAEGEFGRGFTGAFAATWLNAEFVSYVTTAGQNLAGKKLPGVPAYSVYGELAWRHAPSGFLTAIEARWVAKVYADDANSDAAESYAIANWRGGFEQRVGRWRFAEFVRVDNLFDAKYVGSVIVNAANGQFFEPSPTRNFLVGITAAYAF